MRVDSPVVVEECCDVCVCKKRFVHYVNLALRALTKAVYILLSEEFGSVEAVTC